MPPHITIKGHTAHPFSTQISNVNLTTTYTTEDIDRFCLRTLRCPDSLVVKTRLKKDKDKLLLQLIEWILHDPQYKSWKSGDNICLLWIKGGAGKGKTMMSIGLIEQLLLPRNDSTVVAYFFCQNDDYELNTLAAIIKGLILQLVNRQEELKKILRDRWDTENNRFVEDITSWRTLWDILLEILGQCKFQRVYVIVDALDECQDNGMADFLKLIVRTGLNHPARIKWLLTSRPLDSAEKELLAGHDQVQVSLELNSRHVSEAVKNYITEKVKELDRRNRYGGNLKKKVETELTAKAEDTFLWVSLVCKRLESVHRDKALVTIQTLPPGLHPLYHRILNELSEGEPADVKRCMRLLRVMMLTYRPLKIEEVGSVTHMADREEDIKPLVGRCASFIKMQDNNLGFVHQSARDYLAGKNGQFILNSHEHYGHAEIAQSCLSQLSKRLKVNIIELPRPDATKESLKTLGREKMALLARVDYAATFWVQHLEGAKRTSIVQDMLGEKGTVDTFLHTKLLEWLECLSLLDRLPRAIGVFQALANVAKNKPFVLTLLQDAIRFLLRHYYTLANWPLQVYSSAVIFSPESSIVRRENVDKIPTWLIKIPRMEDIWASLIQTLVGHLGRVTAVAFSPDGKRIASGSDDGAIKLWNTTTGDFQKTLAGHSDLVRAVAFSPDSKRIVSGSSDGTIKLWDATTGDVQKTLARHSCRISAAAFSRDGKRIASGSVDGIIKLWDATTGDAHQTLARHSGRVYAVAFSPDGKQIASGSDDGTIKLWDITKCLKTSTFLGRTIASRFRFHSSQQIKTSGPIYSLKFSADNRYLATNIGRIRIEKVLVATRGTGLESLEDLCVGNQWIYYGAAPVLRLPSDFLVQCYDVQGDQIAIGLRNGRLLRFTIDRNRLQ